MFDKKFYLINAWGEMVDVFPNLHQISLHLKTDRGMIEAGLDKPRLVKGYYISSTTKVNGFKKPQPVYLYNDVGNLVDVIMNLHSVHIRMTNSKQREKARAFYVDKDVNKIMIGDYRLYKEGHVPDHVTDLNKTYAVLDKDGRVKAYFRRVGEVAEFLGLTRQAISYQLNLPTGYIKKVGEEL